MITATTAKTIKFIVFLILEGRLFCWQHSFILLTVKIINLYDGLIIVFYRFQVGKFYFKCLV